MNELLNKQVKSSSEPKSVTISLALDPFLSRERLQDQGSPPHPPSALRLLILCMCAHVCLFFRAQDFESGKPGVHSGLERLPDE